MKVQALMMYFFKLQRRADERTELAAAVVNAMDPVGVADAYAELVNHNADNVHVIADEVALLLNRPFTGRTLRKWANKYVKDGTIEFDKRGLHRPEHFLDDEDTYIQAALSHPP